MSNLFELASREKYRFISDKHSNLTVEDLWDLPLKSGGDLDMVARRLNSQIKSLGNEESFIAQTSSAITVFQNKLDIVKHIIAVKSAEVAANVAAKQKAQEKAKIVELINRKKDAAFEQKSVEELEILLANL